MDIKRAKELLFVLSDGVNPLTGEVLSETDSCNQVEIVRALNTVLRFVDDHSKKSNTKSPENAGLPWSQEDETALCQMYDSGYPPKELCAHFKRSTNAIAARLVRLGKIKTREEFKK